MMQRLIAALFALPLALAGAQPATSADLSDWKAIEEAARGQTVYFNAWGGAQNINDYVGWAGEEVKRRYGVNVVHVKLDDTAHAVARVVAEKATGKDAGGSVDLVWINGENFAAMKAQDLLLRPGWADRLPNWRHVDHENKPTITMDFTVPVEGLEAPWGMAKMVFFHDTARNIAMPDSFAGLVAWAREHPGRFSYPAPPDFLGSSFLKQALSETIEDPRLLLAPVEKPEFDRLAAPLFASLDELHSNLWRSGRTFPKNKEALRQMLGDNEIDIAFAFSPAEASNAIANGELPDTVRSFVFSGGTLGNTHFVAIPYNATAREGALVLANFLLSPEAQLRKQDPSFWGDPTVLAMEKLQAADRAAFAALDLGIATLRPDELGPTLNEPHATWMTLLEEEWMRRYGVAN